MDISIVRMITTLIDDLGMELKITTDHKGQIIFWFLALRTIVTTLNYQEQEVDR